MTRFSLWDTKQDNSYSGVQEQVSLRVSDSVAVQLAQEQWYYDLRSTIPLLLVDVIAVACALALAAATASVMDRGDLFAYPMMIGVLMWACLVQHIHGLYPACGLPHTLEFRRILRTCLIVFSGVAAVVIGGQVASLPAWASVVAFGLSLTICLPLLRTVARSCLKSADWWAQPVLIVGTGTEAEQYYRNLDRARSAGLRPRGIAFVSDEFSHRDDRVNSWYLGPISDLENILRSTRTCRVVVADSERGGSLDFGDYCGIPHVAMVSNLPVHPTEKTRLTEVNGQMELQVVNTICNANWKAAKRLLDLAVIVLSLPVLVPVVAILSLAVRASGPGPIFYAQQRIGRHGRPFFAWKFRSMVENADAILEQYLEEHPELRAEWVKDHKLKNDPRITSIGKILRKTSLDELPQVWNVVLGEMSLVGPRPIVSAEISKYGDVFELYKLVPPGITGLWQVSGRNNTTYEERLELDRRYIQNWSCMLDIYILYRTIKTALLQEGAY